MFSNGNAGSWPERRLSPRGGSECNHNVRTSWSQYDRRKPHRIHAGKRSGLARSASYRDGAVQPRSLKLPLAAREVNATANLFDSLSLTLKFRSKQIGRFF